MRHWFWIAIAVAIVALAALIYPLVQTQKRLKLVQSELGRANEQIIQARAGAAELERVVANLKTELDAATRARTELQGRLDEANSDNEELRTQIDAAQSELQEKEAQGERLTVELDKAKSATAAAKAGLTKREKQLVEVNEQLASERQTTQSQIEALSKAADEAKAKISETETRVAGLTEQLEAASAQVEQLTSDRDTAQSKLGETQSQLEAMETELTKAKKAMEQANENVAELEKYAVNAAKDAEAERSKLQAALDHANAEVERLKSDLEQEKASPSEEGDSISQPPGQ
jgi:chromosome segregation ATPase